MSDQLTGAGPPNLDIIILNFRTPDLTIQCLRSIAASLDRSPSIQVTLVDNDSGDESAKKIEEAIEHERWQVWCELLESKINLGFAGGNNLGIQHAWQQYDDAGVARPDFVLLLNSDTIVHPGCFEHCIKVMEDDPSIGALSCRLLNADGSLQVVCRKFPDPLRLVLGVTGLPWKLPKLFSWADTEYHSWNMDVDSGSPDWIGGAFMMLRREALEQVGLLDEDFFFYGEDIELCYRIRRAGWEIRYEPVVITTHLGGSSSDNSRMVNEARIVARWRARYLFLRKSYGLVAMWCVRFADIFGVATRGLFLKMSGRGRSDRAQALQLTFRVLTGRIGPLA
jgi:N-acetylglucosaminyl-diphospho-decaprenol L-rhamnosyltransferase